MRQVRTRIAIVLVGALATILLVLFSTGCGGSKPVIRLYDGQWESLSLNIAIFQFIAERGYGYPVETVVQTTKVMQTTLSKGEIDLNLEGWQQNILDWYNEELAEGNIVNLGPTFEGGSQFYVIPGWVAEQYEIETVEDIADHWDLFRNPQNPSKGIFYNCTIGSECADLNQLKMEAYGLTRHFDLVPLQSWEALRTLLAGEQDNRRPVFAYYWSPTPLMWSYDWHVLKEPPFTPDCWEELLAAMGDANLRPLGNACSYKEETVDKLAYSGLDAKAPDLVAMLKKMDVGLAALNDAGAWAQRNGVEDWREVALYYLRTNEDRWKSWVTPEAFDKVRKAMAEVSS